MIEIHFKMATFGRLSGILTIYFFNLILVHNGIKGRLSFQIQEIVSTHYDCSLRVNFQCLLFFSFFYFAPILDNLFRLYAHPKSKSAKKMLQIVNDVIPRRAKFKSLFFQSCQCVEMNPNQNRPPLELITCCAQKNADMNSKLLDNFSYDLIESLVKYFFDFFPTLFRKLTSNDLNPRIFSIEKTKKCFFFDFL